MSDDAKSSVLGLFPAGMFVVTAADGDEVNGFTANWVQQVSFEPQRLMVAVENDGHSLGMIQRSGVFGVCVLESGQRKLAAELARTWQKRPEKLQAVSYTRGSTGVPLLTDALGCLECRVVHQFDAGDHTVIIGDVVDGQLNREGKALTIEETGFHYSG